MNFAIQAANAPGADAAVTASSRAREKRQFGFVKKAIKGAVPHSKLSNECSTSLRSI